MGKAKQSRRGKVGQMRPVSRQVGFWRDSETLYRHALAVTEKNWFVEKGLGTELNRQADTLRFAGRTEDANRKYEEAVNYLRAALEIYPKPSGYPCCACQYSCRAGQAR